MSTRQRLIEAAIALFNERGLANVSVRDIAATLSISPGNLTYHFANKQALVEGVLTSLVGEMESAAGAALRDEPSLAAYKHLLQHVWAIQRRYRFFYLDAVEILRTYPKARALYRDAVKRRLDQSRALFVGLAEQGLLEPLTSVERNALVKRSWMIVAGWPYRLFVLEEKPSRAVFVDEVLDILSPHATSAGAAARRALERHAG